MIARTPSIAISQPRARYIGESVELQYRNYFLSRKRGGMAENFDTEAFYAALNAARLSSQMTWKDVADAAGVAASTLSRMAQGAKPDVNGLAGLLRWSGLKAEMFIPGTLKKTAEPIARITALLRADPQLTPKNAKLMEEIVMSTCNRLKED